MASLIQNMFSKREPILSPDQLKRLDRHQYKCESCSLLDPYMQHYWNWLVKQVPMSLAPNLITITGLVINILTTLVLISYSPDAQTPPPRWACLLCAIGLFIYQSLDAIDGKQARRTGSSSPLGELFDHGCDSLSTVFVAVGSSVSLQLGTHPGWMLFKCTIGILLFYCAHWQTYVTGELKFGKIDVTEAQFVIIGVHLLTAFVGPELWYYQVPLPILHPELRIMLVLLGFLATLTTMYENFTNITTAGVGKSGSTVAGTSVLSPSIPISFVVIPAYVIYLKSEHQLYETQPCLYILTFGLVAAKITNCLVIAHMTKSEMEYLDSALFGPLMLFLNQYFNFFLPEHFVLWVCCVWSCFDLYRYCSKVCIEICNYLGIRLFVISTPTKPSSSTPPSTPSGKSPPKKPGRPATRAQPQRLNKPN